MWIEIFLAIIQSITEFLPISSSGHLSLFSNLFSKPNLFFFTALHFASLFAVLIFTRKEIYNLISFNKDYRKMWTYLIIATIPAALVGYLLQDYIEKSLSSFLFLGIAFIFTGFILLLTKFSVRKSKLNVGNSFIIGLFQALAVFPGVSRSGMTISSSIFLGVEREKAIKFSFLLYIPLVLGAMILEIERFYFDFTLLLSFFICLFLSLIFLNLLFRVVKQGYFWMFSFYCFIVGLISLSLYFFR